MKEKDRDIWDNAIRSKLDDFEAETMPGDWDAIADRLPGKAPVPLRRTLRYWVAAAIISLLVVSGGIYMFDQDIRNTPVAQEIERQNEVIDSQLKESLAEEPVLAEKQDVTPGEETVSIPVIAKARIGKERSGQPVMASVVMTRATPEDVVVVPSPENTVMEADEPVAEVVNDEVCVVKEDVLITKSDTRERSGISTSRIKRKSTTGRKWGFGMGGGGFSMGADNLVPQYVTNSSMFKSESLTNLNAVKETLPETDIQHKAPIGLGLSISRYLNKRFALQTGVAYSYLRSEWSTNSTYHIENDQRLHFIGIPLSVTYKIAEWNRLMFYASAGGMAEVNVAGKRRLKLFADDNEISSQSEHVRMKEWLWSVNTRVGMSYPIIRFVSAFAEVGAAYYFDNGSEIETIHSEKPFNVSLQFGFRFGF